MVLHSRFCAAFVMHLWHLYASVCICMHLYILYAAAGKVSYICPPVHVLRCGIVSQPPSCPQGPGWSRSLPQLPWLRCGRGERTERKLEPKHFAGWTWLDRMWQVIPMLHVPCMLLSNVFDPSPSTAESDSDLFKYFHEITNSRKTNGSMT